MQITAPLRWFLIVLAGLVLLVLLVFVGVIGWLSTASGRDFVLDQARENVPGLTITGAEGSVFDLTADRLTMADDQGVWLTVEDLRLAWSPMALLGRTLAVDLVSAERVALDRLPAGEEQQEEQDPFSLPIDVAVDLVDLERIELAAPVLGGTPAVLTAEGSATLPAGELGGSAQLQVTRIDDQPGALALDARYIPNRRLELSLQASEPEGGVIATLLEVPGRPPVEIELEGAGPLTDWTGRLSVNAGDVVSATAEARIRPSGRNFAFGLDATADIAALLPPDYRALVGRRATLAAGGFVVPGQRLSLDGITIDVAAGNVAGQGIYGIDDQSLRFGFSGALAPDSPVRDLLQGPTFRRAQVTGKVAGPLAAPDVSATISVLDPAFGDWTADRLTLTTSVDPADEGTDGFDRFAMTATAVVEGPVAAVDGLEEILGPRVQVELAGDVTTTDGTVQLDRLALDTAAVDATGQARLAGWGETAVADLNLTAADLAALRPLAGLDLSGALALDVDLTRGADGAIAADLSGTGTRLATGIPAADALLSPETALSAEIRVADAIRVPRLRMEGPRATITGSAALADDRLEARVDATVPELAPLGQAVGQPLAGSATLQATASGPLDGFAAEGTLTARNLRFQGRLYEQAELAFDATGLPTAPEGTLSLDSAIGGQPLTLSARYDLEEQRLSLPELTLQAGQNRIAGALDADLAAGTATGDLSADLPNIGTLAAIAGERMTGSGTARISLSAPDGRQRVAVEADLRQLVRRLPDAVQRADRLFLDATYTAGEETARVDARFTGDDIQTGGGRIDRVVVTADGPLSELGFTVELDGNAGADVDLRSAGTLALEDQRTRIALSRLTGAYDGEAFQLADPATITVAGEGIAVDGLVLTSGEARLSADADLTGTELSAVIETANVPLAWARLADPTLVLGGELNGRIVLSGTVAAPTGSIDLTIRDFRTAPDRPRTAAIDADLDGQWRDGRLALTLTTMGEDRIALTARAGLPLTLAGGPLAFTVPPDGAISADLDGRLEMALLNDVLAATGDRVAGRMQVDLTVAGTVGNPDLSGTVAIAEGRYENQQLGTAITDIEALLEGDPDGLTIRRFQGRTPNDGTVRASGAIRFDEAFGDRQLDLRLVAERARVAQTDLATADADAELTLTGSFEEALLAGDVRVRQAYITIPDDLPTQVVDLDVVEVNSEEATEVAVAVPGRRPDPDAARRTGGPQRKPGADTPATPAAPQQDMVVNLRIDVTAPNELYVQGRGLDAEFKADLDVRGTADQPSVLGRIELIKGELSLLGQTLTLDRAVISFPGDGSLTPTLDIEARTTRGDVTAIVQVTGTPDAPRVSLSSDPPLPEDEVLAQLLFSRGVGQLSAVEALQLAQGAAQLTGVLGSGPGVLDKVRRGLGVDRLEFKGSETGEGLGSVAAGRYLGDDIYVGVEQDLDTGQSQATVEYDVNENIQLKGEVGRQSKVGVQFEWDY